MDDQARGGVPRRCARAAAGAVRRGQLAKRLGMALVHDERHGLWALGPQSDDRAAEGVKVGYCCAG
jgi:hypothetical protein